VEYLRLFGIGNPPKISCLMDNQRKMLSKLELDEPYPVTTAPSYTTSAISSLPQGFNFNYLEFFLGSWRATQKHAAANDIKVATDLLAPTLNSRVSLRRGENLKEFYTPNEQSNEEDAAQALNKVPQIVAFGCYRTATDELRKLGYTVEAIVEFGDPKTPLVTNVALGFRNINLKDETPSILKVNIIYIETPSKSTIEAIKTRQDNCGRKWFS